MNKGERDNKTLNHAGCISQMSNRKISRSLVVLSILICGFQIVSLNVYCRFAFVKAQNQENNFLGCNFKVVTISKRRKKMEQWCRIDVQLWELRVLETQCVRKWNILPKVRDPRSKSRVKTDGGGSNSNRVGVDLTVLWFYGVRPWPVAPGLSELRRAGELALALVECGTGKSRSARLRLVPMHSLLPLSPHRVLWSRVSSPPFSLSVSLSFSRLLLHSSHSLDPSLLHFVLFAPAKFPHTNTLRLLRVSLRARHSSRSSPVSPSLSIHITYMTHIYRKQKFLLSFSLSPCFFFFLFQIPFCVSGAGTHANS